ncbi:hypothetical protein J1N35_032413 [Gossypium stocksii]|uniref:Uncharacterized protein n=1 Tax=Gossypium stocksii TaxID=47602 RepID=A0A9D3V3B5_9ROSI|nr:hypothetical protein J1N35_032413 [Gossypium stocksii]
MQAAECSRDLDALLENGHLNAGFVFLNSLSEGLKLSLPKLVIMLILCPVNLLTGAYVVADVAVTKVANSQDGARYTVVAAYLAIRIHSLAVLFWRSKETL